VRAALLSDHSSAGVGITNPFFSPSGAPPGEGLFFLRLPSPGTWDSSLFPPLCPCLFSFKESAWWDFLTPWFWFIALVFGSNALLPCAPLLCSLPQLPPLGPQASLLFFEIPRHFIGYIFPVGLAPEAARHGPFLPPTRFERAPFDPEGFFFLRPPPGCFGCLLMVPESPAASRNYTSFFFQRFSPPRVGRQVSFDTGMLNPSLFLSLT